MGRFASTVGFYAHARQPYGAAFFARVAERFAPPSAGRLLDLGTGPGLLALGFSPFFREIVAVDPEPAMILAAREAAAQAGIALRLIEGRAETLPASLGPFDVVTIGRALHWMDPAPTCAALDRVVGAQGCILICRSVTLPDGRNPWLMAYDEARRRWTDAANFRYGLDPEGFFTGTRFRRAGVVSVETEQTISVDHLIDRVLSMSSSSPDRVGEAQPAMAAAIREALAPFAPQGFVHEIVEARAEAFASAEQDLIMP